MSVPTGLDECMRLGDFVACPFDISVGCKLDDIVWYATLARRIGKHWWRYIVYQNPYYGRCTEYLFQREECKPGQWRAAKRWPSYNPHDGETGGLPKSLNRLYETHKWEIEAVLNGMELVPYRLRVGPKPEPRREKPQPEPCRQRVLFDGMDCLAGQMDLFEDEKTKTDA